jgi:hypothetical protein
MNMGKYQTDSVGHLRAENQELRHELSELREHLAELTRRAEAAQKSAVDAWAFAKLLAKARAGQ